VGDAAGAPQSVSLAMTSMWARTGYCNRRLEDMFHRQSRETDRKKRKELVWDIDTTLQEEGARPVIFHTRGATCWHPQVRGLTTMVNSIYNGWRMEDVWLYK
jgi:peptide/nickel transport system substrate-binding protein